MITKSKPQSVRYPHRNSQTATLTGRFLRPSRDAKDDDKLRFRAATSPVHLAKESRASRSNKKRKDRYVPPPLSSILSETFLHAVRPPPSPPSSGAPAPTATMPKDYDKTHGNELQSDPIIDDGGFTIRGSAAKAPVVRYAVRRELDSYSRNARQVLIEWAVILLERR